MSEPKFDAVEREAEAQLAIIRAIKHLTREQRQRVMIAALFVVKAEEQLPGILSIVTAGLKSNDGGGGSDAPLS